MSGNQVKNIPVCAVRLYQKLGIEGHYLLNESFSSERFFTVYLLFHFFSDEGWEHQCLGLEQKGSSKAATKLG
jgi:hypothetical protein